MGRHTTITVETTSFLIVQGKGSMRAWCPRCGTESDTIALESLGVVSNLDRSAVEEWLNSGELHRIESNNGSSAICLHSLLAHLGRAKQLHTNGAAEKEKL